MTRKEKEDHPTRRFLTVEGRSVEEAMAKGLAILGASRDRVRVQILSEERKGLFGMRGAKQAKVRIALKP